MKLRSILAVRHSSPVFGVGTLEVLAPTNERVFAYLRTGADLDGDGHDDIVLCVNNLSRSAQPCELDLSRWASFTPVEMLGTVRFPPIGELPLHPLSRLLTLTLPKSRLQSL